MECFRSCFGNRHKAPPPKNITKKDIEKAIEAIKHSNSIHSADHVTKLTSSKRT